MKVPTCCDALCKMDVAQFAGGSKCLYILTRNGMLYACGDWQNGRLGIGPVKSDRSGSATYTHIPQPVTGLSDVQVKCVDVHTGGRMAMAITVDGELYSWGDGETGQLGHGDKKSVPNWDKFCCVC